MQTTLKKQYEASNLATRDNVVFQMICCTQSDFKTIAKYQKSIEQGAAKWAEREIFILSWLQSSFFGWAPTLTWYHMYSRQSNIIHKQKQELEKDKIIVTLVDNDRRLQFLKRPRHQLPSCLINRTYGEKIARDSFAFFITSGHKKHL